MTHPVILPCGCVGTLNEDLIKRIEAGATGIIQVHFGCDSCHLWFTLCQQDINKILEEWAKRVEEYNKANPTGEPIYVTEPMKHIWKCECGAESIGASRHSAWCDKYVKE